MKRELRLVASCLITFFALQARVIQLPAHVYIWERFERDGTRRQSGAPFLSGDTFRAFCDHILDETKTFLDVDAIKAGDTVFVVADFLPYFFRDMYPHIDHPFILVSHNRDESVPGSYASYLDDEKIVAWFSINIDCVHPKLHAIPIGIANGYWPHGKVNTLKKCLNLPRADKNMLLCATFVKHTHVSRREVYAHFENASYCSFFKEKSWDKYLLDLRRSHFVLSPRGNGVDCHRTWEALYMGAIPVVPSTDINSVYEDLPVVIVDDWAEVTEQYLKDKLAELCQRSFNYEKLYTNYWFNLISAYANSVRGR